MKHAFGQRSSACLVSDSMPGVESSNNKYGARMDSDQFMYLSGKLFTSRFLPFFASLSSFSFFHLGRT